MVPDFHVKNNKQLSDFAPILTLFFELLFHKNGLKYLVLLYGVYSVYICTKPFSKAMSRTALE